MSKKIALICYEKKNEYTEECLNYIERLFIPEDACVDFLLVSSSESIFDAYQEGMESTDAEIKLYFTNDLFITNQELLIQICELFEQEKEVGAIGLDGWNEICRDILCNERPNVLSSYQESEKNSHHFEKKFLFTEAVYGELIATRVDTSWIEPKFKKYPYPVPIHSLEIKKKNYKLAVLNNKNTHYVKAGIEWDLVDLSKKSFYEIQEFYFTNNQFAEKRFYMPESGLVAVDDMKWALIINGYDYVFSPKMVDFMGYSEREKDEIIEELKRNQCNCAITRDFSRTLARACYEMNIPYIAWSYDTPLQTLYREEAKLPTNHIFSFDKKMIEQAKHLDENIHLYPIPLAVNMDRNAGLVVSTEDEEKYQCEISMVGSLYENNFYRESCIPKCNEDILDEVEKNWLDKVYGNWRLEDAIHGYLSDECINAIQKATEIDAEQSLHMSNRFYEEVSIAKELTYRERVGILNRIAEKYHVVLYTGSNTGDLKNVICKNGIDYYFETPKVFHLSKINLNVTLRSIESGVIQRIYDIMAVGGFVLTNAQPEIADYFEIGKEIVVYHDIDEMMDLIEFYLSHDEERIRIAMNGYRKVREQYNYQKVIENMIQIVFPK